MQWGEHGKWVMLLLLFPIFVKQCCWKITQYRERVCVCVRVCVWFCVAGQNELSFLKLTRESYQ